MTRIFYQNRDVRETSFFDRVTSPKISRYEENVGYRLVGQFFSPETNALTKDAADRQGVHLFPYAAGVFARVCYLLFVPPFSYPLSGSSLL